ncbi:uncharacterized protein LOC135929632 isoform X3 [Gordionus sp. m RMFG-2023]|uniref:uncharacterized protein LOC135929632 isoform X3 n=1 Tax=Gordionus sp. m RMFG-2023 TaxID=3053472 RepID=UPI0031FC15CE
MDHIYSFNKSDNFIHFISIHKKGLNLSISSIIMEEMDFINYRQIHYPKLSLPLYNDEGDLLIGWWRPQIWRATCYYAYTMAKIIHDHIIAIIESKLNGGPFKNFLLLSNDNAFLNQPPFYFEQRTLLAGFIAQYQISRNNISMPVFIKKPVYGAFCLLSYLGNTIFFSPPISESANSAFSLNHGWDAISHGIHLNEVEMINYNYSFKKHATRLDEKDDFFILPTISVYLVSDESNQSQNILFQIALLYGCLKHDVINVYLQNEPFHILSTILTNALSYTPSNKLPFIREYILPQVKLVLYVSLAIYVVNDNLTNPYSTWMQMQRPTVLSHEQITELRKVEGHRRIKLVTKKVSLSKLLLQENNYIEISSSIFRYIFKNLTITEGYSCPGESIQLFRSTFSFNLYYRSFSFLNGIF